MTTCQAFRHVASEFYMNDASQHYLGHRARLRSRFLSGEDNALPDYELLELLLFAAKPRGDVKPLAKALIKHCGSFAKVFQAHEAELRNIEGVGDAAISTIKSVRAAAARLLLTSQSLICSLATSIANRNSLLAFRARPLRTYRNRSRSPCAPL